MFEINKFSKLLMSIYATKFSTIHNWNWRHMRSREIFTNTCINMPKKWKVVVACGQKWLFIHAWLQSRSVLLEWHYDINFIKILKPSKHDACIGSNTTTGEWHMRWWYTHHNHHHNQNSFPKALTTQKPITMVKWNIKVEVATQFGFHRHLGLSTK